MKNNSPIFFIEINQTEFIFFVGETVDNNYKFLYFNSVPIQGISNNKILDHNVVFNILKNNFDIIEKKLNIIFKEVVVILNNLECSTINFSGLKKLNGSQLLKENVTYILNSLKSKINETEEKKKILHIFNSNFY